MDILNEFNIPFVGLKEGKHNYKFTIDKKFFEHFEFTEFIHSSLKCDLVLNKKSTFLEINFKVDGKVTIPCDVSTELFEHEIKNENNLIVKFGSSDYESDDILVIPEGSYQINVAQHIYETIVLSLPLKRIHPGVKNGTLKSDILEKLKALEPKKNNSLGSIDPRWNKLKDLL